MGVTCVFPCMAYRLKANESIGKGLRRVVTNEVRDAIELLSAAKPSDEALHEARKSIKKIRAIIDLVGDEISAARAVGLLREAGRLLSPLRDADALVVSADALCKTRNPMLKTCSALQKHL